MKTDNGFAEIQHDIDEYGQVAQILFEEAKISFAMYLGSVAEVASENVGCHRGYLNSLAYVLGYLDIEGNEDRKFYDLQDYVMSEGFATYQNIS